MLAGAVLADYELMQARLVRGFIAMAFTARVRRQTVMSVPPVRRTRVAV
jgi:hypothetical protein